MHKIVEAFAKSSDDISTILKNYTGKRSPVTDALVLLSEMTAGSQTANGAVFIARNTPIQDEDADLGIMMLAYWAKTLAQQLRQIPEKTADAQTVIQRARTLQSSGTPKEIQSLVDMAEADILDASGNVTLRDSVVQRALKRLTSTSARLPWMLAQYALMLARSGRLSELSRRLSNAEASYGWPAISASVLLAHFINHVETCNIHQAEQLLGPLSRQSLPARSISITTTIERSPP